MGARIISVSKQLDFDFSDFDFSDCLPPHIPRLGFWLLQHHQSFHKLLRGLYLTWPYQYKLVSFEDFCRNHDLIEKDTFSDRTINEENICVSISMDICKISFFEFSCISALQLHFKQCPFPNRFQFGSENKSLKSQ